MAVVSFLQRFIESAADIAMTTGRNLGGTMLTPIHKPSRWAKRGKGLASAFDFHNTRAAGREYFVDRVQDSMKIIKDPNRHLIRRGVAAGAMVPRSVLGAVHTGAAAATDVVGMGAAVGATAVGAAITAPLQLGLAAGALATKGTMKSGWWLAKKTGLTPTGVMKAGGMAGAELARDGGAIVAGTGKMLWRTRKDPLMGTALVGGAIAIGGAMGAGDYEDKALYGSVYGGPGTGMGRFNPEIQAPAWALTPTYSPYMDIEQQRITERAMEDDTLGAVDPLYGPLGHDFGSGATGDLVFALHRLRNGGGQL